jgi:hypothetical protein
VAVRGSVNVARFVWHVPEALRRERTLQDSLEPAAASGGGFVARRFTRPRYRFGRATRLSLWVCYTAIALGVRHCHYLRLAMLLVVEIPSPKFS